MRMSVYVTVFLLLLTLSHNADGFNILAIISQPLRSHYIAFGTLFRELAVRGHNVTVMNNFVDKKPVPNLKFIDLSGNLAYSNGTPTLEFYENKDSTYLHVFNVYRHFVHSFDGVRRDCENLLTNKKVKEVLSTSVKFDVIFVEQFMSDCALAYAASFYDAPIIGITSHVLLPWSYRRLGLPFDYASDAYYFSNSGSYPSIYHKIENVLFDFVLSSIGGWFRRNHIYEVFNKYVPNNSLDIERVARERMKMVFAYQHFSLTGARVLAPQLIEIAGIHIKKPKPVPEDVERFLSNAEHGAIYVSFGSNLISSTMSRNKLQEFLDGFKRIPQKVLWKFENATLPAGNENVYTSSWLPQLDILCHPKVLAFVTHGGMLSLSEATYCGKPVLALPFFGDQFANAATVRASGLGITMFFERLNAKILSDAIRKLTLPEKQQEVQKISKLWHDRPQHVMDSAIYWTEYVARHGSAPPSLPSKNNTWFESLLLDVYSIVGALFILVCLLLFVTFKLLKLILVQLLDKLNCKKKHKSE